MDSPGEKETRWICPACGLLCDGKWKVCPACDYIREDGDELFEADPAELG
ncbi:hypothetical protein KDL44_11995 [bacterium]|nr:hypothetical protein [bacterium]